MVDVVSIIIAVISFVGALLSASITGWFAYFSEERKRLSESEKLIAKYRDPLLLASTDLQSRLYNILELGFLGYYGEDNDDERSGSRDHIDNVLIDTCFLIGQYFSWTYILRRQVQFLRFSTNKDNKELVSVLSKIQDAFSTDRHGHASAPFLLWRGHQMAIGEIMTVKDDTDLFCMGYAAFTRKWKESQEFRGWFHSIETSIKAIAHARSKNKSIIPDHRLRRLHHLFLDLIDILDPKELRVEGHALRHCPAAPDCACLKCSRRQVKSPQQV